MGEGWGQKGLPNYLARGRDGLGKVTNLASQNWVFFWHGVLVVVARAFQMN